jgi:hypothetical protein
MACCEDCAKVRSTEFIRVKVADLSLARPSPYHQPLDSEHRILIPFKALIRRGNKHREINYKVGVIGSHGRIGQTAQGAGSMLMPGDTSILRSPVRSGGTRLLTPNGVRIPNPNLPGSKPTRGFRCPEGFQFGGRFTDQRYSTCGQMLFDIPSLGQTISNLVQAIGRAARLADNTSVTNLGAVGAVDDVIVRRAAQIPRVGADDIKKRTESISKAVTMLGQSKDTASLVVRRDGFTLMPVVSSAVLRTIPDNRNMEKASYIMNVQKSGSIGGQELGLLSNAGISELVYALPNGSTIRLGKTRDLTVGERRKLGRTVNSVSTMSVEVDPASRLRAVAAEMGTGIKYTEDFKNIDNPNDLLDAKIGKKNVQVRRWVNELFLKKGSQSQARTIEKQSKPTRVVTDKPTSSAAAIEALNNNDSPFSLGSNIVAAALAKSDAYKTTKRGNATIHTRADGKEFIEQTASADYQHLGERVYSDVAQYLGMEAPQVGFIGSGSRRGILSESVDTAVDGAKTNRDISPIDVPSTEITKVAALDWMLDTRQRDSTTLVPYNKANKIGVVIGQTGSTGLAGLSPAEIRRREAIKLEEFYSDKRVAAFKEYYANLTEIQRRQSLRTIDTLIQRASDFSWEDYIARLSIDGELSDAEKRHLVIIQKIFESRVGVLKSSRERFITILGQ